MRNGQPHILVVGAADTGRAPLLAALLRRTLGHGVSVDSAGVLAHAGEPADTNVALALEQLDASIPTHHIARQLDGEAAHDADLIVAVDPGIAHVAATRLQRDVLAINEPGREEVVPDPHRMPLGVWIAALRNYETQIAAALPLIRERLRIKEDASPASTTRPASAQRQAPTGAAPTVKVEGTPLDQRTDHVTRIVRLFETARLLPEIVDWSKVAQESMARLRSLADLVTGTEDLTPAAALIVMGLLAEVDQTPAPEQMQTLQQMVEKLATPVDGDTLVAIAKLVSEG